MNIEKDNIRITEEEAGERIDKILTQRYEKCSRSYFQHLIKDKQVLINGKAIKKQSKMRCNDEVEIHFTLPPEISLSAENIPLDILYEDEHIIAVNKAVGMVVHPAAGNWSGTFVNALLYHCRNLPDHDNLRPGIVHRLDKDTSGLILAAKTNDAHKALVEQFSQRNIEKQYIAICVGNPGTRFIQGSIARNKIHRKMMCVSEHGKEAFTKCTSIAHSDSISYVKLHPKTGRTHQLRVHLKHVGTPILGDQTYGNPQVNTRHNAVRQLLHAHSLSFKHPITNEALKIEAPIPADIQTWMNKLCD